MATTPQEHIEKLIADKLWLRPLAAIAQFRDLFGTRSTRLSRNFLLKGKDEVFVAHPVRSHATHLNTPTVIAAYRASASGLPPALAASAQTRKGQFSPSGRRTHDSTRVMSAVTRDIVKYFNQASTGQLKDILPLRACFADFMTTPGTSNGTFKCASRRDAFLLKQLTEEHGFDSCVHTRLANELAALRAREDRAQSPVVAGSEQSDLVGAQRSEPQHRQTTDFRHREAAEA